MTTTSYDLVLEGGRVIDPAQGIDEIRDVAFQGGRVAGTGQGFGAEAQVRRDVTGEIVTPGLIDMHTHVYWGGTSLGIDAKDFARLCGVTTAIDTGSAGAGNFPGFRHHVIDRSAVRILAYLHVSFAGIFGFTPRIRVGESEDYRLMSPQEAIPVIAANRDAIVGIKVRIGRVASGGQGIAPLDVALDLAEEVGLPVMCHIDEPPPSYEAVVAKLRPGDVLTHCFRPTPNAPIRGDGTIKPEILAARRRGVFFDVGHGMGSFSWRTARGMLDAGFEPDSISSDIHAYCIDGPAFDQLTTLSKFLALGMLLGKVIAASPSRPSEMLGRPDLGNLREGSVGDATILDLHDGPVEYVDVVGQTLTGTQRLKNAGVVIGGAWWYPQ